MNQNVALPAGMRRLGQIGPILAILGLLGSGLGGMVFGWHRLLECYLYGWVVWMGLTLGCYAYMMLHNITTSKWGQPVIRVWEAGAKNLILMAVLFVPIVLFAGELYPWAQPAKVAADHVLRHRGGYMNTTWFFIRTVLYFTLWIGSTLFVTRYSRLQDQTGNTAYARLRTNFCSLGGVLYVFSVTFAFTDWTMSLEPHWYSTIYGAWFVIGQSLWAVSFASLIVTTQGKATPYAETVTDTIKKDLGNLMLVSVMVWAYFSLSQWLIIWSGNLPDEVDFYVKRLNGLWLGVGTFNVLFSFFGPFLALLSGKTKRVPSLMKKIAMWLIFMRIVDLGWIILPSFPDMTSAQVPIAYGLGLAVIAAIGGVWLTLFVWWLRQARLVPVEIDPAIREAVSHA